MTQNSPINHRKENSHVSDEENTSEYSHPPSSQRSTLESNPEGMLPSELMKRMQQCKIDSSSSESDCDGDNEEENGNK
jgi:mitogen-activated protein kinase kinase kinase 13